jgi:Tol biopolymer transport system component
LVNVDGQGKTFLTEGWNPEWSPDGKQIAFFRWGEHNYPGIGIISKDGTGFHWVYESPEIIGGNKGLDESLYFACSNTGANGCRLTWSPDGRYLVFSANQSLVTKTRLLRLDLKTNQIIFLLPPEGNQGEYIEPDWKP